MGRSAYANIAKVQTRVESNIADGSDLYPFYCKAESIEKAHPCRNDYKYGYVVRFKGRDYNPRFIDFEPNDLDRKKSTVRIKRGGKVYILWFFNAELKE